MANHNFYPALPSRSCEKKDAQFLIFKKWAPPSFARFFLLSLFFNGTFFDALACCPLFIFRGVCLVVFSFVLSLVRTNLGFFVSLFLRGGLNGFCLPFFCSYFFECVFFFFFEKILFFGLFISDSQFTQPTPSCLAPLNQNKVPAELSEGLF